MPNAPRGSKKVKLQAAELLAPYMTDVGTAAAAAAAAANQAPTPAAATPSSLWQLAHDEVDKRRAALLAMGGLATEVTSSIQMVVAANDWYRLHRLLEIIMTFQNELDAKYATRLNDSNSEEDVDSMTPRFQGLVSEVKKSAGMEIDLRCFFIGGERTTLYKSIDRRCVAMLTGGLLEEVTELYLQRHIAQLPRHTSGYAATKKEETSVASPTASAAIGYRQTLNYLCRPNYKDRDAKALVEYIECFATATRNYAKRQLHWYRKDANFLWIHDVPRANSGMLTTKKQPCTASRRMAEELSYWAYEVTKEQYSNNLTAQVGMESILWVVMYAMPI